MVEQQKAADGALTATFSAELKLNTLRSEVVSAVLNEATNRYEKQPPTTAEIAADLVKVADQLRDSQERHEELRLRVDEVAFNAVAIRNDSTVVELGDAAPKAIARDPLASIRHSATIGRNPKESMLVAIRSKVRHIPTDTTIRRTRRPRQSSLTWSRQSCLSAKMRSRG